MADLSDMLTQKMCHAIRRLTMEETRDLVFQMGVPLNILDDIADQYSGENHKQHFVQAWLDMDRDASWEMVVTGLRKINKNALADKIESKHLSITSSGSPLLTTSSVTMATSPAPGYLKTATIDVSLSVF